MTRKELREKFCDKELEKGTVLILWRDVDNEVCGWSGKADKEDIVLRIISEFISQKKVEKLEQALKK